ncbi:MAG: hypothetical protein KAV82_03085 [Phycisphaerae bacterium]|nr:hypothetical protein [Phycisphaerae bacterium]
MKAYRRWVRCLTIGFVFTCLGCQGPTERLNAPPQGYSNNSNEMQKYYTVMVDNAMLHDMCIADIHFVPHTAEINGLGTWRLQSYSRLLHDHGGTIHFETVSNEEELTDLRLRNVSDFLASTGLDMTMVTVKEGLPRGRATEADEAIRIKQEGTVTDHDSDSESGFGGE